MNKIIISILLVLLYVGEAFAADPIVYSRCKRTTDSFTITADVPVGGVPTSSSRTFPIMDGYDVMPDVKNFFTDISGPCDLVYRDASGVETVIYDCSTTGSTVGQASCAALDAQVSPDGTKIAFSVFRGTLSNFLEAFDARTINPDADAGYLIPGDVGSYHRLPNKRLIVSGAELMYRNMTAGTNHTILPYAVGTWDSGPTFLTNNRVAFTSTRDGHRTTLIFRGPSSSITGTRIWSVDLDGKNLSLDSHHSLSQEQHPFILKNGRVAYSSWQILGGLPFRHNNGSAGYFTTEHNLFQVFSQYPDGSENFALCCMHSGDHTPSYYGEDHNAGHFITQTTDERIWFVDYYRGNNQGLGAVIGFMEEPMIEGFGLNDGIAGHQDLFAPRDAINLASWAVNSDNSATITVAGVSHPNYAGQIPWYGKLGHPFAMTSNGLGVVWGKGNCSIVTNHLIFSELGLGTQPPVSSGNGSGSYANHMYLIGRDIPACDLGIYKTTTIPSSHPSDLSVIVDTEEWHELFPRVVLPYQDIYGVVEPKVHPMAHIRSPHWSLTPGEPFGLLGAPSIVDRETEPFYGITFQNGAHPEHQFNLAGTDTIDYTDDELCGIRLLGLFPNRGLNTHTEINNVWGERVSILGELHVKHYDGLGNRILDPLGNPDTSFLVKLPANVPHITQAIDCDGRTLNTDQTWQTVKPGEMKTCGGCHIHSRESLLDFHQSYAATTNYTIPELGKGVVPLLNGKTGDLVNIRTESAYGLRITLEDDIKPIFDARCISCHGDSSPAAGLNLSNTSISDGYSTTSSTWFCLVADYTQSCVPEGFKVSVEGMYAGTQFRRPQLTKYMRALNSRGSLLLWKAANQRLDNRTDGEDAQDINFGADHPTSITAEELGILSRWIDMGAPAGPQELKDTQKPTLHLAANVVSNEITQLIVGTVDLGAGINPASLNVCLVSGVSCGPNLAGTAEMHGMHTITLGTAISDPNQIIRASVSDTATSPNTTTIEFTAGYLMSTALSGNPDVTLDEETDYVLNIVAPENSRVFVSGYPRGSVFNELNRTLKVRPDFTQSGTYTVNVTSIDGLGVESIDTFTITVNDTIQTVDPVIVSTTDLTTSWQYVIRFTTDEWLDVPGLAGRTLDYKVRIPKTASPSNKMPLDIYFHGHGSSEAFISGGGDRYGIGPFDPNSPPTNPGSWHVGNYSGYPAVYNQSLHTFENTAQRRILQVINWIDRNYPGRDPDRTNAWGASMGGSGATFFAIRYPYLVSEVHQNAIGMTIMRNSGDAYVDNVIVPNWGSRINPPIMNDTGMNAYDFYDLARAFKEDPRVREIQWQTLHGVNDGTIIFNHINTPSSYTGESFFEAAQNYGVNHRIFWHAGGHALGEGTVVDWWYGALPTNSKSRNDLVHPAFANSSIDDVPPTWNGSDFVGGPDRGAVNRFLSWNSDAVVDEYNALEIPIYVRTDNPAVFVAEGFPLQGDGYTGSLPITADVTIRRAQKFKLLPFETVNYVYGASSGTVTADVYGEVTLTNLAIGSTPTTIELSRSLLNTPATVEITVGSNATITEGDTFSRTITFTDGEDTGSNGWTYDIDWCGTPQSGSVSAGGSSFNISRLFSTAGSCLVSVTVTDGVGEFDTGTFTITIEEGTPPETVTISVGGPGLVKEGSSLSRVVSMSDVSNNWTYTLSVDNVEVDTGTITNGQNNFSVEHTFLDGPAVHNVDVEILSSVPALLDTGTFQVTVLNVEPTVTITGNTTVTVNTPYTFSYSVVDPGDDTVTGVTVDWGDNNYSNMTTHTYTSSGEYRITIWIEDEDGIWNVGSFKLTVTE